MDYKAVIDWFGTQTAIAKAIGVRQPTVFHWQHTGVPPLRQLQIERLTKGALRADDSIMDLPRREVA